MATKRESPTKKGGRPRGSKSPASRANGAKGGRKRDKLPADVLAILDAMPRTTVGEIQLWNARTLVEIQRLNMHGKISNDLAASLRAGAGSIDRALPRSSGHGDQDDEEHEDDDEADHEYDEDEDDDGGGDLS